ncbi:MAG TPA: hypothetical protein VM733_14875 [Thermoanaerobaculia bacterium]|nr:hypothetical protein [Thermoanaerobaculia bacterium]
MKRAILFLFILALPARGVESPWIERWREDLRFFRQQLPTIHPAPFNAIPAAELDRELDELAARVPRLSHSEITTELARIVARIGDGHTRLTWPLPAGTEFVLGHTGTAAPKDPALVMHPFPIRFGVYDDGVFAERVAAAHRELAGAELIGIDGVTIEEAIQRLEPVISRDNRSQALDLLPLHLVLAEVLHARKVTSDPAQATFRFKLADGRTKSVTMTAAAAVDWVSATPPAKPLSWKRLLPERLPGRGAFLERHWMEWLPDRKTLYVQLNESYDDPEETLFDFAARVRASNAETIVLDLRYNFGGDNTLNQPLLHALIANERLRGPGRVRVLIGRGTFSAAMMLALDLEKHVHPIFIGEPTGGRPVSYGDSRKTVLPNSGITIRISTLFWQYSGPKDDRESIAPHIAVPVTWKDALQGRDAALEIALAPPRPIPANVSWRGRMTIERTQSPVTLRDGEIRDGRVTWRMEMEGKPLVYEGVSLGRFVVGEAVFDNRRGNPFPFAVSASVAEDASER